MFRSAVSQSPKKAEAKEDSQLSGLATNVGKCLVKMVEQTYFKSDNMDRKKLTKDVLAHCNVQRNKFSANDFTKSRSGRGGGLAKAELDKVQSFGKVGFEQVRRRLKLIA